MTPKTFESKNDDSSESDDNSQGNGTTVSKANLMAPQRAYELDDSPNPR